MKLMRIFSLILASLLFSCHENTAQELKGSVDYRLEMRNFVIEISESARAKNENFIIIPQNGIELIKHNNLHPAIAYLDAISGVAQEDLFYGYPEFDKLTPGADNAYLRNYLDFAVMNRKKVLVTDYSASPEAVAYSYQMNNKYQYVSFAANRRQLDVIPDYSVFNENKANINSLEEVKNFLYILNYAEYPSKRDLIAELSFTNYDLIILDLFFNEETFTKEDLKQLKKKKNGGDRLVIAYMSIGEAEDYRYYWKDSWNTNLPEWMLEENPDWEGNFKIAYWNHDWKNLIYGNKNTYLDMIINAGFDGVYLDIIDAFQYFEAKE